MGELFHGSKGGGVTRLRPSTPEEVAAAISLMVDFCDGSAAGTNVRIDWSALDDGVREFLSVNLKAPVPAVISKVFEYRFAREWFVEGFPDLVGRIQSSAFEAGTLGHFLAECVQGVVSNPQDTTDADKFIPDGKYKIRPLASLFVGTALVSVAVIASGENSLVGRLSAGVLWTGSISLLMIGVWDSGRAGIARWRKWRRNLCSDSTER